MPMNWNEAADAKLFAGVLATSEGVKLKYDELAKWMGNDCTAKAIQHRITNVRKMTKDTETSTPAKDTKTPKTNGKRKAAKDVDIAGSGDESPTKVKKPRASPKKATPKKVEAEAPVEDGDDMDGFKGEDVENVRIEDAGLVEEVA